MIISRTEFHNRYLCVQLNGIANAKTKLQKMSVAMLLKEAKADAAYRNHLYMFNGTDLNTLPIQETTVGIKARFPDIKTEQDRLDKVELELLEDSYAPVKVSRDADYHDIIYIEDGFHRIYAASKMKLKSIRCEVTYGKFRLEDSITFEKLIKLLTMVDDVFKGKSNKEIIAELTARDIDTEKLKHISLGYGKGDNYG